MPSNPHSPFEVWLRSFKSVAKPFFAASLAAPCLLNAQLSDLAESEITLTPSLIGSYQTGIFDEGASEIVSYDAGTQRAFVINSDAGMIDVLDMSDPTTPTRIQQIDVGGNVNSVAVHNGIGAAAVEGATAQDDGQIVVFACDDYTILANIPAGALPDCVVFGPGGQVIMSANEGEPSGDYTVDPEGTITLVKLTNPVGMLTAAEFELEFTSENFTVSQLDFNAWDGREAELRNAGVRIFGDGDPTASQDIEPEFVAIAPNGEKAYVTLQENNALAIVDLEAEEIVDIVPLGFKDHSRGLPELTQYEFTPDARPVLGTSTEDGVTEILTGGFSGLCYDADNSVEDVTWSFYTVGDRGPNGDPVDGERPFLLPDYQAKIYRYELDLASGVLSLEETIPLTRTDGTTPITGLPNIPGYDEVPVDGVGGALSYDEFGADLEGIIQDSDGTFWMCDEYRPAIYHFDTDGTLINRFVPEGAHLLGDTPVADGTYGDETLPEVYNLRRANRGFEAIALDTDNDIVYAFIQTPLDNPDTSIRHSDTIRILAIDGSDGTPVAEYVYLFERNANPGIAESRIDKIGDAVYVGDGQLYVIERDSSVGPTGKKFIFKIDLNFATDILDFDFGAETLEQQTADSLEGLDIAPVVKIKVANLPSLGYLAGDKPEGLTMLPDGTLAVVNDNDFGIAGDVNPVLGIITFPEGENGLDASDRDDEINIANWPVYGMFMPDTIDAFELGGRTFLITANEGDAREYDTLVEEERIKDLDLNPAYFADAGDLQENEEIGRLNATSTMGDWDNDGEYEALFVFGGRSFSIWDEQGNLVYDSGSLIEEITAELFPDDFNANNDENDSLESRSDNKGPEPEAVEVASIGGRTFAFVGLERMGGFLTFDISVPWTPLFLDYTNNRDFSIENVEDEPGILDVGDLGPECIRFIPASDSPNGVPLILVGNEITGSTSVYTLAGSTLLQILHASDLEGGVDAIGRAANFAAIVEALEDDAAEAGVPSLLLSAGDNYIPGPFFSAASDSAIRPALQEVLSEFYGVDLTNLRETSGRIDIAIMNVMGFDASALGNHEFDAGLSGLEGILLTDIRGDTLGDVRWLGTQFPYLSSNLDFSASDLAGVFTDEILPNTDFMSLPGDLEAAAAAPKIAPATLVNIGGEYVGVVGATTQLIESISSPGDVSETTGNANNMAALAAVIQPQIDELLTMSNKIVLVSHLQQIALEKQLAGLLNGVDVIIAGGSDTLQANEINRLHSGDVAAEAYPYETVNADDEPVLIVSTDGEYSYVGRLVVGFDLAGVILPDTLDEEIIGPIPTDNDAVELLWGDLDAAFADGTNGAFVMALTDAVGDLVTEKDGNIVGYTDVFIEGRREKVRTQETTLGNLTADANLWQARVYDDTVWVSIKNGGGIRAPIGEVSGNRGLLLPPQANPVSGKESGDISQLDLENSLRFNNQLSLLTVTAQELYWIMEYAVSASEEGATPGQFPQVGGIAFAFDPDGDAIEFDETGAVTTPGTRILDLVIMDAEGEPLMQIVQNGEFVAEADTEIRLVTLNFMADGGDGYPFDLYGEDRVDLVDVLTDDGLFTFADPGTEQDALAEFLGLRFLDEAYNVVETRASLDMRIQNLNERSSSLAPGFDVDTNTIIATAVGGTFEVTVDTLDFAQWDASEELPWLSFGDFTAGEGDGVLEVIIDLNNNVSARGGFIEVAGRIITVSQAGADASEELFSIDPNTAEVRGLGSQLVIRVSATEGADWSVASNVTWVTAIAGGSGVGDGIVILSVGRNTGGARTGTVTIAGETLTINQAAAEPNLPQPDRLPSGVVTENEDGSFEVPYFGRFFVIGNQGWTVHDDWGFAWLPETQPDPDSIWFFAEDLGWLYTSDDVDPFVYSNDIANWLYLLRLNGESYLFSNEDDSWTLLP